MMTTPIESIQLTSERLYLKPLTLEQLLLYRDHDLALEVQLGFAYGGKLTDDFQTVIATSNVPFVKLYPSYILYGTIWIIVQKQRKLILGDIGFKGAPTEHGLVEVGYGIFEEHRKQGYMAEALGLLTDWAFADTDVKIILAETDKTNIASQKTLLKNNFIAFAETEKEYWWRKDKVGQMPYNEPLELN